MRNIHRLLWTGIVLVLLPFGAAAQQPIRWQPTLESAKRLAIQTDRLVLVHFWADWCQACQQMDRELFSQPSIASVVEGEYVPVKINADYFPTTCKQYGVTSLPTDVIIDPQGHQIDKLQGPLTASEYVARLDRVAAAKRQRRAEMYAQLPTGQLPTAVGRAYPPRNTAAYGLHRPDAQRSPNRQPTDYSNRQLQAASSPAYVSDRSRLPVDAGVEQRPQPPQPPPQPAHPSPAKMQREHRLAATAPRQAHPRDPLAASANAGPAPQSSSGGRPSENPPLGLDGYCPVQLTEDMKAERYRWTLGDRRWGVVHRGRTYLFAGPEQKGRFWADPDRYAPVLSGDDVVIAVEQGQAVPGRREHGVLFNSKVYLFAGEASLEKFRKNPSYYSQQALQAMRAGENQRRQWR